MENKGLYINDLPPSGDVTFLAVVIEKELRSKRNGGSFLSVRLADRSGELDAKAWDNPEAVAQLFDCNDVVKVRGAIEHYNDKPQLIVSRIRRCEPKEYTAADFYPASHRDPEVMFGELETFVAMVRDETLRQLLESGVPLELKTILQHFVVSHHGELDKGALRRPMLPEAFALSLLDLMDARLEQVFKLIDSTAAGEEFTSYVPSLNVSCSPDARNRQNRALNRKPSKEVKQHEHRTNCNQCPRAGQGIEHVRDRRIAGGSGRSGGAGSQSKQW